MRGGKAREMSLGNAITSAWRKLDRWLRTLEARGVDPLEQRHADKAGPAPGPSGAICGLKAVMIEGVGINARSIRKRYASDTAVKKWMEDCLRRKFKETGTVMHGPSAIEKFHEAFRTKGLSVRAHDASNAYRDPPREIKRSRGVP